MLTNIISNDRNLKIIVLIYRLFVSWHERKKRLVIFGQTLFVSALKVHLDTELKIGLREKTLLYGRSENDWKTKYYEHLTHACVLWAANVLFAGFAPAFTLSLCDSEYARSPPKPIASVVMRHPKKKDQTCLWRKETQTKQLKINTENERWKDTT